MDLERRAIRIRGVVQGVGFRPAMFRLADALGLAGFVRNDREGVWLEIEGAPHELDRFVEGLPGAVPPAARIDAVEVARIEALGAQHEFRVAESPSVLAGRDAAAAIPADLAPCSDCLRELADPTNRRYRYPFINCTACGPRFTIVRDVPYDRPKTTMGAFAMCDACLAEYEDPRDRRFHAEPNACPACGPRARIVGGADGDDAVRLAADALRAGTIVAVKGAGGFVLAVDATNEAAVLRLRERKRRPHKPFAVMGRSLGELARIAVLDDAACSRIASPVRPIVLVPSRKALLAPSVAPGLADVGVYLPPTPLQQLLVEDGPALVVMTSGNLAEEPIARTDAEARERLASIADVFLIHDREIHARADDSVVRAARHAIPVRRARGFVPAAIDLPVSGPPVLAVGGHERNTVCLAAGGKAVLSQHVGDLDHPESMVFFEEAVAHLSELVGARPELVVHDRHPDYRSTRWALACGLPAVAVQHHHAHVAACLAEHGRKGPVIGIAFDGTGLGDDGTLWGGEVLEADLASSRRVGRLRPIALPGGEAAIRQPWRLAVSALLDAGESLDLLGDRPELSRVAALLATDLPPRASGAGRWFDAVAALLGVADEVSYDGQAAAQLEAIAAPGPAQPLGLVLGGGEPFELDLRPAIRELAREIRRGTPAAVLAARFHVTLAHAIRSACKWVGARTVVLTGGCFQNRRLLEETVALLEAEGREVLVHRDVPPNDGGLALGQAAIALARSQSCA
jgi:hydrogenase maturation protein HypF